MESKILYRTMVKEDWAAVSRIYQQGIDTNLATFQTVCPTFDEFDKAHLPFCRFVAESKQTVVGWAVLSPISSRYVYRGVAEVSVYIDEKERNRGVGKALLHLLVEESEKQGIWTLQSSILSENKASIALHDRCGFRLVGRREKIARDRNGNWKDTFLMEKRRNETDATV
ncbi:sortase-like acyltransferase [Sphaerochaeta pleomorpha str. Grapes]|uniref:Sortase-like acyltransferase n=1 Tax=Sphaerochaeta pleomorpha (strain ATCC BAA-1885 / DSM 22778 / Grapes) TaxID=158190 RepID=G8QYI6_SPHPG|nr:GNAT family N-acetyltransferase [Sphaerochaeta pleomorpha]AEV28549.1 sortase-like acyltransferase [Sphaerochaeta pleomorpha str. Grapes]